MAVGFGESGGSREFIERRVVRATKDNGPGTVAMPSPALHDKPIRLAPSWQQRRITARFALAVVPFKRTQVVLSVRLRFAEVCNF